MCNYTPTTSQRHPFNIFMILFHFSTSFWTRHSLSIWFHTMFTYTYSNQTPHYQTPHFEAMTIIEGLFKKHKLLCSKTMIYTRTILLIFIIFLAFFWYPIALHSFTGLYVNVQNPSFKTHSQIPDDLLLLHFTWLLLFEVRSERSLGSQGLTYTNNSTFNIKQHHSIGT